MRKVTQEELNQILADHALWLYDQRTGERAQLKYADLSNTNLTGVDLSGANLFGINLSGANLSGANLSGANLIGVELSGAHLSYANFTGAKFGLNINDVKAIDHATFSQDAYEWLILRDDWAKVKDTVKIVNN